MSRAMRSRWAQTRAVARLARRTARREWRRTTLVAALVMVPVMVGIVVAGLVRASDVQPAERLTAEMGAADLRVQLHPSGPEPLASDDPDLQTMARLVEDVDADRTLRYRTAGWYRTGAELLDGARVTDLPLDDPLAEGMFRVLAGRAPQADGEIALGERVLQRGGLSVGDTVELDGTGRLTIVGEIVDPTDVRRPVAVTVPATLDRLLDGHGAQADPQWLLGGLADPHAVEHDLRDAYYRATGLIEAQQEAAAQQPRPGAASGEMVVEPAPSEAAGPAHPQVVSRASLLPNYEMGGNGLDRVMTPQVIATMVAAVLLAEVALIAGAAYATGARRRLRELGLLGANGATTGHVRGAVVGEATVTGIVGGVAGVTAGVAALAFGRPLMQRFVAPLITRLELSTTDLLGPALVAVLAVTVAAWLPARTAARVPTTTALEGRMPLSAPKRWIVPAGIGLAGFGALLLLAGILASGSVGGVVAAMGVLLAIAGTALLTVPMIAGIGRVADRFPATLRLVLRDSGRQRTRAAAASASAMVVLIAPVLIATISLSTQNKELVHGLPAADDHVLLGAAEQLLVGAEHADVDRDVPDRDLAVSTIMEMFPDAAQADVRILDARASVAPDARFTPQRPPDEQQQLNRPGVGPNQQRSPEEEFWHSERQDDTHVAVATDDLVAALDDPALERAIDAGELVVLGLERRDTTATIDGRQRPAVELPARVLFGFPRVLVPPSSVTDLGLDVAGTADLFVTRQPITHDQRNTLHQAVATGNLTIGTTGLSNGSWLRWTAVGATLVVALLILALVTMLSATESDHDLRTMVAVGAPPRLRRRFLGLQSGIHALVGAVLAVPLATALAWAASRADADYTHEGLFGAVSARAMWLDWPTIGAVLLGVPLVIGVAIALLVRSAATVPPRRAG